MARIRTIKPEFWQDEEISQLPPHTQLLAIGLLNHSDDEGYFKAHPALIKSAVFPFSDHSLNVHDMLIDLSNIGYLTLHEGSDGKKYGKVTNFEKHQKVNRPQASKIKGLVEFTEHSVNDHGSLTDGKEQGTGNREQGTGKGKKIAETSSANENYAFEGEKIKINHSDFEEIKKQYPSINLLKNLRQLDIELRQESKWWMAMHAKLRYRNEQASKKPSNVVEFDPDDFFQRAI